MEYKYLDVEWRISKMSGQCNRMWIARLRKILEDAALVHKELGSYNKYLRYLTDSNTSQI